MEIVTLNKKLKLNKMAQGVLIDAPEMASNENSISTKEFLNMEKTCEAYKDSDEEIKMIFTEINKLSGGNNNVLEGDVDDVELILKRAEDIALETENLLKMSPVAASAAGISNGPATIPRIKVSKPIESDNKSPEENCNSGMKVRKYFYLLFMSNQFCGVYVLLFAHFLNNCILYFLLGF